MKEKLTLEIFYAHPPERVWKAITDPAALSLWLLPGDFSPIVGSRFMFRGELGGKNSRVSGTILEADPGKRLIYTWDDGEEGTAGVVAWTLTPKDGGTQVRLEHAAPAPMPYVLIEANVNWRLAVYASLPVILSLLRDSERHPPVPMVYVREEPETDQPERRAGFRVEEPVCV